MQLYELLIISVGLAMDAFAVSICKGLVMRKKSALQAVIVGLWFGAFQAIMPLVGFFVGSRFRQQIEAADHWIAFALLAVIGIHMIYEAVRGDKGSGGASSPDIGWRTMLLLAVATSVDALVVGITLAIIKAPVFLASGVIGAVTFVLSFAGVFIGKTVGAKWSRGAQMAGGVILVLIGVKILIEHTMT